MTTLLGSMAIDLDGSEISTKFDAASPEESLAIRQRRMITMSSSTRTAQKATLRDFPLFQGKKTRAGISVGELWAPRFDPAQVF